MSAYPVKHIPSIYTTRGRANRCSGARQTGKPCRTSCVQTRPTTTMRRITSQCDSMRTNDNLCFYACASVYSHSRRFLRPCGRYPNCGGGETQCVHGAGKISRAPSAKQSGRHKTRQSDQRMRLQRKLITPVR